MGIPIPNPSPARGWLHPKELSAARGPLSDTVIFACLSRNSPSAPIQDLCPLQLLKCSHVFLKAVHQNLSSLKLWEEREALSAPPCAPVGSLVPVPLCSGSFPEGTGRELDLSVCGSAGGRAVGDGGGRSGVRR